MISLSILLILCLWFHVVKGQQASSSTSTSTVNIKIGAICSEFTDPQVLQLALYDILQNNYIIPQLSFQFEFRSGCKDGTGLDYVSELHYVKNITALLGPNCSEDIDCVAKLVTLWQLPVITYAASVKNEKTASPVSRIAPTTANTLCDSIITILDELSWDKIALFYNAGDNNVVSQALYLIKLLNTNNIQSKNFELPSSNLSWYEFQGMVDPNDVQRFTRVVILLMGDTLDENLILLQHLRRISVTTTDYVIFLPWINEDPDKNYPWIETTIDPINYTAATFVNGKTKKDFVGCFVIDSDKMGTNTTTRFFDLLANNSNVFQNRNAAFHSFVLYDSLKLLVLAVNQTYTQMGFMGPTLNSTLMFHQIAGINFEGASGMVEMDSSNERIPFYSLYEIKDDADYGIFQVAKLWPVKYITDANKTTYFLRMTDLDPILKNSLTSLTTEPACGFQGYKCDYSKWYVISGSITVIVILGGILFYLKKRGGLRRLFTSNKTVASLSWHIPIEKVEIVTDDNSPRTMSHKSESELSTASGLMRHVGGYGETAIVYNNIVKIRRFKQLKNINFDQTEAQFLLSLKQLVHDNINPIVGLCYNNPTNELLVLSKFCSRGTLSEYLHNPEMRMDGKFKTAFLRDIINGLDYLHNAPIGYHGNLTTSNCVIDANFIVKLVSVGMEDLLEDWKDNNLIEDIIEDSVYKNDGGIRPLNEHPDEELLFRAPEFLRKAPPIRPKLIRMSKNEQIRIKLLCRMGDIYSLGILFFEVLFRQHPYADVQTPIEVIINKIRNPTRQLLRPTLPKVIEKEHHPAMIQLMQACWSEDAISRPPIKRVKKLFSTVYKVRGGLVDSIIQIMDQHANSLEKQVRERTRLLEEAQLRADRLLAQMIPKDIARDLKLGRPVIPRGFDSSSVLFTDIVSFTTICSKSTPMEIVNFLNDLFTGYDAIISQTDAYKVETIGDAYLVVSGVPNENGTENIKIIATIALQMRQYLSHYKLPHNPDFKMEARWGLHSGPVAAGVVGLIAPRYCLFGDTVNMASRMESTGEAGKIQTSLEFHAALSSRKDPFIMEKRGTITVKGKGDCLTYWLVRASDDGGNQSS